MTRKEERINYIRSFKVKDVENEELKDIIRLAILDGALWADKTLMEKISTWIIEHFENYLCDGSGVEDLIKDLKEFVEN